MRLTIRAKNLLRPLVHAARRARWVVQGKLKAPVPWGGEHDPALLRHEPWRGEADGRFHYDFLGIRTDPGFRPQIRPQPEGPLTTEYPHPQYEYLELVFVLESVAEAGKRGRLTVMELGAGYGKWLAVTHHAARGLSMDGTRLIGVEMTPRHFTWMKRHLENNGIDPTRHRLIHAAVSDRDGRAWYRPEADASDAYGHSVYRRRAGETERTVDGGRPSGESGNVDPLSPVSVRSIGLSGLLRSEEWIDLIHCDIQGEELHAIGSAMDELNRRVGRLLVATHSRKIHRRLRALLEEAGWECRWDFRMRGRRATPYGDVWFLDGLLAFVNPSGGSEGQT